MIRLPADRPAVMGILNVTPDSFSDGGAFADWREAADYGRSLAAAGADIVDVGGESTRPGAVEVPVEEEMRRVIPVVSELASSGVPVSIDTRKATVAEEALRAGAVVINDVSGFRDPDMVSVAAESQATVCIMHMKGEPRNMQSAPFYKDVVEEVKGFLAGQADLLSSRGVPHENIWVDPGIGFGKRHDDNLVLLRRLEEISLIGFPVLVGVSRKSFLGTISGEPTPRLRLGESIAAGLYCLQRGARILRVHDVAATVGAIRVWQALQNSG